MKKTLSCADLHYSLFAAPGELRHCCQRFFVNGEMKGDVPLFEVDKDEDITIEKIVASKKELYRKINAGEDNPCKGCPLLKKDEWPEINELSIKYLSIEPHSVCNLRCNYCSDKYYGGKKPTYDVVKLGDLLAQANAIAQPLSMVWGGGEPILMRGFDQTFAALTQKLSPNYNNVFTNAIFFNETIAHYISEKKASITTSIDAGTKETYEIIRGKARLHRVLENLKKYAQIDESRVTIKYILMEQNCEPDEISSFVRLIKEYQLQGCAFQISGNYKCESVFEKIIDGAIDLYKKLKSIGAHFISIDEHIRGRISKKMNAAKYNNYHFENIVIWGASEYAETLLNKSHFFKQHSISYFVDSNKSLQGKKLKGYDIKHPKTILDNDYPIFIASAIFYREIFTAIQQMGADTDRVIEHILV